METYKPHRFIPAVLFFLAAVVFFLLAIASAAHAEGFSSDSHIRPLSTGVGGFVAEAIARSPTIRALASRLDDSDLVVYVRARPFNTRQRKAQLVFMTAAAGRRYLLVEIACSESWNTQIAMLGHELRHAVEIADAPAVRSDAALAAHYRRIGMETVMALGHESFETLAAADAGRRVTQELSAQHNAKRQARPSETED